MTGPSFASLSKAFKLYSSSASCPCSSLQLVRISCYRIPLAAHTARIRIDAVPGKVVGEQRNQRISWLLYYWRLAQAWDWTGSSAGLVLGHRRMEHRHLDQEAYNYLLSSWMLVPGLLGYLEPIVSNLKCIRMVGLEAMVRVGTLTGLWTVS